MSAARRLDHPGPPRTDFNTHLVMEQAVNDLAYRRFITTVEPRSQLHLLASLAAQIETWMAEDVATARAIGLAWRDIGELVGLPAAVAARRHRPPPKPTTTLAPPAPPAPRTCLQLHELPFDQ